MSQKKTYSIWHDACKAKELSIQMVQNKFINTFGANIVNITKVDWNEIELRINKLIVEYNDTLWMEFFPNHENQINSSNKNIDFVWDVVKPSLHELKKYYIFLEFHVIQKTKNNQFSIDSLQLLKNEIHLYSIFPSMVHSLNEKQLVLFDDILYKK
jgi:hypothetical protein